MASSGTGVESRDALLHGRGKDRRTTPEGPSLCETVDGRGET
jgi:hypothetical protein